MATVALVGGTGLAGAPLVAECLLRGHEVYVVTRSSSYPDPSVSHLHLHVAQPKAATALLAETRADIVVNLAAVAAVDQCEAGGVSEQVNAVWPAELAEACADRGVQMVHFSTDAVFDTPPGSPSPTESSAPNPVNAYALQKRQAELGIEAVNPDALILRTNFFGPSETSTRGLFEWSRGQLSEGKAITGFSDVFFNPLGIFHLAKIVLDLVETSESGILHVGASSSMSKYDFLIRLACRFGWNTELIERGKLADVPLKARRPKVTCMDIGRVSALLNRSMPSIEQGIEVTFQKSGPRHPASDVRLNYEYA